ncbi:MAG: hypothetical protein ABIR66_04775 [Saprospiraceae bacterium]
MVRTPVRTKIERLNKYNFISLFVLILVFEGRAQSTLIPIGSDQEFIIDRMCLQYGTPDFFHRNIKPYYRNEIMQVLAYWDSLKVITSLDDAYLTYLCDENDEWTWKQNNNSLNKPSYPDSLNRFDFLYQDTTRSVMVYRQNENPILKYFYKSPAHLIAVNNKDFYLRLNPIINLQGGKEINSKENIISNQRGLDFRMGIDDKIYAQTTILENQFSFPAFYRKKIERHHAIPGAGLYKFLTTSTLYKPSGYDYFISNAQFGIRVSKHFHLQLGHGNNFIGDGLRSLYLSDYAQEYFYLKLNTTVWKLQYQNIFAELSANTFNNTQGNILLPKKYMAAHTLQLQILPAWHIGVFESVIFHRNDHFEFQYLNPVIIYRSVEGSLGSPDNVMLGINTSLDLYHSVSVYGQLLIDEFVRKEAFNNTGWWGNKFGGQLGIKYINALGISRLDLQAEYNSARPYTYSHADSTANYTHQLTPLAHPLGANFKEWIFKARYQPSFKWNLSAYLLHYAFGDDPNTNTSYGGDINKSYNLRITDFGNFTTQGDLKKIMHLGCTVSYQLFHNYYLDLNTYYRKDYKHPTDVTKYIGGGVRINWWRKDLNNL